MQKNEIIPLSVFTAVLMMATMITISHRTSDYTNINTNDDYTIIETKEEPETDIVSETESINIRTFDKTAASMQTLTDETPVIATVETLSHTAECITDEISTYIVPEGDTSFKAYMDYRTITNTSTPQYDLQKRCYTDCDGFRRQTDDYVVALGSYYSTEIGDRFEITLDTGVTFTAILGDQKADCDTDDLNQYTPIGSDNKKNVVEFVVDADQISKKSRMLGDMSNSYGFTGNIISIRRLDT